MEKEALELRVAELRESLAKVEGTRTEVYARIVGYYRSVRNWNAGKREEYANRRPWSLGGDSDRVQPLGGERPPHATWSVADAQPLGVAEPEERAGGPLHGFDHGEARAATWDIFVRASCPACPPVKAFLAASGLGGRVIDVDEETGLQEALAAGVLSTPTAVIRDARGRELYRARTVTELRASLMPVLA